MTLKAQDCRVQHRGWIEFGSTILNNIACLYATKDATVFVEKNAALSVKFSRLEDQLETGPYFDGDEFTLVDTTFGPIFRYLIPSMRSMISAF